MARDHALDSLRVCPYCSSRSARILMRRSDIGARLVDETAYAAQGNDLPLFVPHTRWDCLSCGFSELELGYVRPIK